MHTTNFTEPTKVWTSLYDRRFDLLTSHLDFQKLLAYLSKFTVKNTVHIHLNVCQFRWVFILPRPEVQVRITLLIHNFEVNKSHYFMLVVIYAYQWNRCLVLSKTLERLQLTNLEFTLIKNYIKSFALGV